MKHALIRMGLDALAASGAARIAAPYTAGLGAILMLHHVRPYLPRDFEPNRILEVSPEFLDEALTQAAIRGYDFIALGDVPRRIREGRGRFLALTFDDGYRDNLVHALPVLEKHGAPFTIFVTTGFADRTAELWWSDLEEALDRLDEAEIEGETFDLSEPPLKQKAFDRIVAGLRRRPWGESLRLMGGILRAAGVDGRERVGRLCLDWAEIRALDGLDLCTIGAHTVTHPILGVMSPLEAVREIGLSKRRIEEMLGRPCHHFAYPVGDPAAAGQREFLYAREAGFATAVTTRPGVIFPEHADHLQALPRLSLNGMHQSVRAFDVLLSGAAFHLYNRGRRLNVG